MNTSQYLTELVTCRLQETPAAQDGAAGAIEGWILRGFACECFFLDRLDNA